MIGQCDACGREDRELRQTVAYGIETSVCAEGCDAGTEWLSLKWGTVKGWRDLSKTSMAILQRYFADGMPMSCAMDRPNDERKQILCELIDELDGRIYLDWDGKYVSKVEAKKYVAEYGAAP